MELFFQIAGFFPWWAYVLTASVFFIGFALVLGRAAANGDAIQRRHAIEMLGRDLYNEP